MEQPSRQEVFQLILELKTKCEKANMAEPCMWGDLGNDTLAFVFLKHGVMVHIRLGGYNIVKFGELIGYILPYPHLSYKDNANFIWEQISAQYAE